MSRSRTEVSDFDVISFRGSRRRAAALLRSLRNPKLTSEELREDEEFADAARMRWLLSGHGYFMEEERLCGHGPTDSKEQNDARRMIDEAMAAERALADSLMAADDARPP